MASVGEEEEEEGEGEGGEVSRRRLLLCLLGRMQ